MNTPNQPKSDMLDRAIEALRTVPTLDRPPSSCVASTLAALNSQPILPVPSLNQQRRQRMFRIARYSGAGCSAFADRIRRQRYLAVGSPRRACVCPSCR